MTEKIWDRYLQRHKGRENLPSIVDWDAEVHIALKIMGLAVAGVKSKAWYQLCK